MFLDVVVHALIKPPRLVYSSSFICDFCSMAKIKIFCWNKTKRCVGLWVCWFANLFLCVCFWNGWHNWLLAGIRCDEPELADDLMAQIPKYLDMPQVLHDIDSLSACKLRYGCNAEIILDFEDIKHVHSKWSLLALSLYLVFCNIISFCFISMVHNLQIIYVAVFTY